MKIKPERLAPAGSFEKAKTAILYGADAVYCGTSSLSLRTRTNMSDDELVKTINYVHSKGKKIYVALNIFAWDEKYDEIINLAKILNELKVDGIIVADGGVVEVLKEYAKDVDIHISTQANTVNYEGCNMWHDLGAERVVLARECSLNEIKEIRKYIPEELELEVFVHGAMCMSYSGRCLLSSYMTGRDSNRGACAQSCRWKYSLVEEKRPNEYFPIEEDQHGTYIMNSKDLCMIEHIPELMQAGAQSLKIEGRNKSEYYLALVVKAYRQAIDLYCEDPENYKLPKVLFLHALAH